MPAIASHSVLLNLDNATVWASLSDLRLAPHYVPGLTGCRLHPGPAQEVGASRRVFRKGGRWLDESVVHWQEGLGFVLRLHREQAGAPFPFRQAHFHYQLQAEGSGTRVVTRLYYQMRGGRLVERLLRKAMDQVVRQIAENLKAFYETGRTQNAYFK
ncbi:SRPBCC family protein [Pseudomonas sp. Au-Pse12]|uniref:SRPBCC family protein n=1 Tax=Pseudomonas sp. Au-Pse12 TaxID=2906459 RepID=UPI001E5822EE|nr:SRPBCC family protein [Pseudomonas sp. Au-Pse12]MCE4052289.1 SRPBCC family protein [Pseudomonas sp. Au-Pse12]